MDKQQEIGWYGILTHNALIKREINPHPPVPWRECPKCMTEEEKKMKVLCVCHAGYVRSAATAMILKMRGFDAIAVGVNSASPETLKTMGEWADKILLAEPSMKWKFNSHHHGKIEDSFTIGEDEWGNPSDKELWKLIYSRLPVYLLGDDSGDLFYRNE